MEEAPDQISSSASEHVPTQGIPPVLGCSILSVLLVVGLVCVWMVGALVFEGEIRLRAYQPDEIRLWMVNEDGLAGIGFSYAVEAEANGSESRQCYYNRVRFFLWREAAQGQPADFCRCYQDINGEWLDVGACEDS